MMKKNTGLALCMILMVLILSACSKTAPKTAADQFLQAVKNKDKEALSQSYIYDTFDVLTEIESNQSSNVAEKKDTALTKAMDNDFLPKLLDFDYTIDNQKIDGDKATVDVHFKTYQLGAAFTEFYSDYMSQAISLVFSNPSEEQLDALAANILSSKANTLTEKNYEKTVQLTLVKKDDRWVVDDINSENNRPVLNAMSGGLIDAIVNANNAIGQK